MPRPCLFKTAAMADDLRTEAERGLRAARNAYLLDGLVAVVQACAPPMAWITVAAFDKGAVADDYAQRCREQLSPGSNILFRAVRLS